MAQILAKGRCIGCSIGIVLGPLGTVSAIHPQTAWFRGLCG